MTLQLRRAFHSACILRKQADVMLMQGQIDMPEDLETIFQYVQK